MRVSRLTTQVTSLHLLYGGAEGCPRCEREEEAQAHLFKCKQGEPGRDEEDWGGRETKMVAEKYLDIRNAFFGPTLRKAFEGLVAECARLADVHAKLGREMHSKVIRPLRDFAAEHRARVNSSWKVVDSLLCKASIEFVRAERARQVSERRAKLYESMLATHAALGAGRPAEEEGAPPPTPAPAAGGDPGQAQPMVIVGNLALTRREFRAMLGRLRAELPAHEVKFGVFGRFRGLVTGHDLAAWWREHYGSVIRTDEEAAALGQSLVDQGYLRHMGRGSAFVLRPTAYYQWKAAALNFGGGEDDSDGDGEGTSGGGGGSTATAPGKTLAQLRSEAEEADQEHHSQVLKAEIYRADLEEQLGSYLETAEAWEVGRLTTLKGLLEQYVAVQAKLVPVLLSSHERQQVCAETIKPAQDIQEAGGGGGDREAFVEQLSERLGAILESVAALHDRHPQRLVRDFLEHYSLTLEPVESSNSPPPLPLSPRGSDGGSSDSGSEGTAAGPGAAPMSEAPLSLPATAAGPSDAGRPAQTPKPMEPLLPATPGPGRGSPSPPTKDDTDFFLKDDDDDDDDDDGD
ncbi:Rho-GTPase-activating protein 8 [Spiromyces aspiralis]|uniref:Rho-GTPase-activating protein 8 n=1 Tax=Spiromyces aspiralis TaxID=68401 RepID=A0ACC1HNW3_9FUNG|nr:Rho-GTPase-activating protein 8 [Spiromyces aspiralis]